MLKLFCVAVGLISLRAFVAAWQRRLSLVANRNLDLFPFSQI
ncbi:MAG: hypothetical protein ACI81V_000552 [Lentimonas sp.]|jgi:hypothetical protein